MNSNDSGKKYYFFHAVKKVTLFHGKILKPISDVKFVNTVEAAYCGHG